MMNVARTYDDGRDIDRSAIDDDDDERRSRSKAPAASKLPTLLVPARAQMSAAEQAPQLQPPRPPLRTRSTGGVTSSSHNTGSSALGASNDDNHAHHLVAHGPGQEFMPADVPSPILSGPNQGLAGLSEALAHLISKNDSAASASSSSHVSPIVSRRGSDSADRATSSSNSNTDIKAHLPTSLVTALIANASNTGRRMSSGSTRQPPEGADGAVHPSQIASGSSSRQPPGGRAGLPLRQTRDRSPPPANIGSLHTGRYSDSNGPSSAALRRGSQDLDAISPLTAATNTSMSQQSSADVSGLSTPQNRFSSRSKPKVLETTHLHLQTHGPSGRRMINQYIIEDELGRGVHGKVRLARNVETGERVAVKIVERESRKRLGGGAGHMGHDSSSKLSRNIDGRANEGSESTAENPDPAALAALNRSTQPQTRFAPTPVKPVSPGPHGRFAASNIRLGRWGEGAPGRPTHGDLELEKQRETARKRLLWTTDQKVKREIAIMKKCSHENVVGLKEVIDDPHSKKIFMVLEYMEGGEVQWKDDRGFPTLTVDDARRTFRDIVLGLEYLHYQGIIHRDIKPANLLWDKEHRVKISDFGVSHFSYALLVASGGIPSLDGDEGRQRDPSLADDRELAKTAGSPAFFAPELCLAGEPYHTTLSTVSAGSQRQDKRSSITDEFPFSQQEGQATGIRARPPITKAIDLWALGVTLFCLLFGHVPFTADSEYALFSVICREDYALPAYMGADRIRIGPRKKRWIYQQPWTDEEGDVDEDSSAEAEADVDPSTLCEDALMVRDLLDRLLEKDPTKRIKLEEVKKHPWLVRDIADPPQWLSETDPAQLPYVVVTHEDVEFALTGFSKFKQTLKRFQSKIISSFAGVGHSHHWHERDSQHSSSRPSTPGHANPSSGSGAPVRRRRSKSASHASRDFLPPPSIRTASTTASSSRTSPQNTMDSRRASHHHAHAKHNGAASHPPIAPSAKPFHFFSRGRSTVLDGEKRLLAIPKYGKHSHIHGTSVSQPNSRPHSPKNTSPPSLTLDVNDSVHAGPLTMSSLASSRRETDAGRPSTAHSSEQRHGASTASTLPKRPASKHLLLRPASRGSLRALDALTFTASNSGEQDLYAEKNAGEGDYPSHLQGTPSTSRNPSSSSTGPARPRSRSRLSDVFKSVLSGGTHHFHHHHAAHPAGAGDPRSLRLRSRPSTAINSAAVTPTFDKSEGMKAQQLPFLSNEVGTEDIESLPLPITAPASPVQVKEEHLKVTHASEPGAIGEDQTESKELSGNAIDVDDYDVDLDFSEDDEDSADEHHHSPSYQNSGGPILRGTRDGWVVDEQRDEMGVDDDRGAILSDTNSLTPSVEGGYNVFKPPFAGRFQLNSEPIVSHQHEGEQAYAMDVLHSDEVAALRRANKADRTLLSTSVGESEGECESDVSSTHVETIPTKHRFARIAQKNVQHDTSGGNAQIGGENNLQDTSVVSEDRFADADEETTLQQVNALKGHRTTDRPHFSLGGSARNSDVDASEGISPAAIDDDDGGVSFQTGKRLNR